MFVRSNGIIRIQWGNIYIKTGVLLELRHYLVKPPVKTYHQTAVIWRGFVSLYATEFGVSPTLWNSLQVTQIPNHANGTPYRVSLTKGCGRVSSLIR
jgi:hypothetical protein